MESNRIYYFLFKYGLLGIGLLFMIMPIISYFFPSAFSVNGDLEGMDTATALISGSLGLLLVLVFFLIKDRFVIVVLKNQTVTIKRDGHEKIVTWLDIEFVSQIQFVHPPLYTLKTKDSDQTLWFNTHPGYISVGGVTRDISEMGKLIRKMKKELDI